MATASRSIRKLEAELETEKSRELVGAGGPSAPEPVQPQQLVSDDMEYTDSIKRPAANIAVAIMSIATLAHAFAVIARVSAAARVRGRSRYECGAARALVRSVVYVLLSLGNDLRVVGSLVAGVELLTMVAATIGFPTPVGHVQAAVQSCWLITHVSVAV